MLPNDLKYIVVFLLLISSLQCVQALNILDQVSDFDSIVESKFKSSAKPRPKTTRKLIHWNAKAKSDAQPVLQKKLFKPNIGDSEERRKINLFPKEMPQKIFKRLPQQNPDKLHLLRLLPNARKSRKKCKNRLELDKANPEQIRMVRVLPDIDEPKKTEKPNQLIKETFPKAVLHSILFNKLLLQNNKSKTYAGNYIIRSEDLNEGKNEGSLERDKRVLHRNYKISKDVRFRRHYRPYRSENPVENEMNKMVEYVAKNQSFNDTFTYKPLVFGAVTSADGEMLIAGVNQNASIDEKLMLQKILDIKPNQTAYNVTTEAPASQVLTTCYAIEENATNQVNNITNTTTTNFPRETLGFLIPTPTPPKAEASMKPGLLLYSKNSKNRKRFAGNGILNEADLNAIINSASQNKKNNHAGGQCKGDNCIDETDKIIDILNRLDHPDELVSEDDPVTNNKDILTPTYMDFIQEFSKVSITPPPDTFSYSPTASDPHSQQKKEINSKLEKLQRDLKVVQEIETILNEASFNRKQMKKRYIKKSGLKLNENLQTDDKVALKDDEVTPKQSKANEDYYESNIEDEEIIEDIAEAATTMFIKQHSTATTESILKEHEKNKLFSRVAEQLRTTPTHYTPPSVEPITRELADETNYEDYSSTVDDKIVNVDARVDETHGNSNEHLDNDIENLVDMTLEAMDHNLHTTNVVIAKEVISRVDALLNDAGTKLNDASPKVHDASTKKVPITSTHVTTKRSTPPARTKMICKELTKLYEQLSISPKRTKRDINEPLSTGQMHYTTCELCKEELEGSTGIMSLGTTEKTTKETEQTSTEKKTEHSSTEKGIQQTSTKQASTEKTTKETEKSSTQKGPEQSSTKKEPKNTSTENKTEQSSTEKSTEQTSTVEEIGHSSTEQSSIEKEIAEISAELEGTTEEIENTNEMKKTTKSSSTLAEDEYPGSCEIVGTTCFLEDTEKEGTIESGKSTESTHMSSNIDSRASSQTFPSSFENAVASSSSNKSISGTVFPPAQTPEEPVTKFVGLKLYPKTKKPIETDVQHEHVSWMVEEHTIVNEDDDIVGVTNVSRLVYSKDKHK